MTSKMSAEMDIVVVSWNSGGHVAGCLQCIEKADKKLVRVARLVVVDNASKRSPADPAKLCARGFSVQVVTNVINVGFAAACNQGAKIGTAEYILFLNSDVDISRDALDRTVQVLAADTAGSIGVVGIGLVDGDGRRQRSCSRFPTPGHMLGRALGLDVIAPTVVKPHFLALSEHGSTCSVDQVMGAFWLMRRCDFERVGGWDERFFLYMEDVDLALRVHRQGQRSLYLSDVTAVHEGGGSTRYVQDGRLYYLLRSRVIYAHKHFGPAGRMATTIGALVVEPAARLIRALARGRLSEAASCMRAAVWLWSTFPFKRPEHSGEARWLAPREPPRP